MMERVLIGILSLGVSLAAAPALAEEDRVIREPDKEIIRKTTTVDFNDTEIGGDLRGPDGSYLPARERTRFESLLKPRTDFLPELEASTEKEGM